MFNKLTWEHCKKFFSDIFVLLDFSSDSNFWLTDKQSSGLTYEQTALQSSGSNFQCSNWQKVQFNTDLLKQKHGYLYRKMAVVFKSEGIN